MHYVLVRGKIGKAHVLIEHGAGVEVEDDEGRTPLDLASEEQREDITKLHRAVRAKSGNTVP